MVNMDEYSQSYIHIVNMDESDKHIQAQQSNQPAKWCFPFYQGWTTRTTMNQGISSPSGLQGLVLPRFGVREAPEAPNQCSSAGTACAWLVRKGKIKHSGKVIDGDRAWWKVGEYGSYKEVKGDIDGDRFVAQNDPWMLRWLIRCTQLPLVPTHKVT